jgi:hypothetical protein
MMEPFWQETRRFIFARSTNKASTTQEVAAKAMVNGVDFTGRDKTLQENIANVTFKASRHLLGFYQRPGRELGDEW